MKTYKTVKEAFKYGTGDVFYKKDDSFVAISRNSDISIFDDLESDNYNLMSYDEVIKQSFKEGNDVMSASVWAVACKRRNEINNAY